MISMPVSSRSLSSVSAGWACPPPNRRGNTSWNLRVDRVERLAEAPPRRAVDLLDRRLELADRRLEVGLLRGQEVEALLQLLRLLDRGEVDLAHALDQAAQLGRARLLLGAEQRPQVVVVHHLGQLDVAVAIGDLLLQRASGAARPPGSAARARDSVCASRLTSVRAARSCGLALGQARLPLLERALPLAVGARPRLGLGLPQRRLVAQPRAPRRAASRPRARPRRPSVSSRCAPRASPARRARAAGAPASARALLPALLGLRGRDLQAWSARPPRRRPRRSAPPSARAAPPRAPRPPRPPARRSRARAAPRPGAARCRRPTRRSSLRCAASCSRRASQLLALRWTARSRSFCRPNRAISSLRSAVDDLLEPARRRRPAACLRSIWRASARLEVGVEARHHLLPARGSRASAPARPPPPTRASRR